MKTWHYATATNEQLQTTEAELPALVENGTVTPATRVWTSGMANWAAASEVMPALFGGAPASSAGPPPIQQAAGTPGAPAMRRRPTKLTTKFSGMTCRLWKWNWIPERRSLLKQGR